MSIAGVGRVTQWGQCRRGPSKGRQSMGESDGDRIVEVLGPAAMPGNRVVTD